MPYPIIEPLGPEGLKRLRETRKEEDYLLVDVRQESEYGHGHIPGATLLPLPELETKVFDLPSDRDLIFYCHVGGRSKAAAELAAEAEATDKRIYSLLGGIMAWEDKLLPDFPKISVFDPAKTPAELLMTAMDLEKGALLFYEYCVRKFPDAPFTGTMENLSKAERGHARTVYRFWEETQDEPTPFEELFARLEGKVLEGGKTLEEAIERLEEISEDRCISLMEISLDIEHSAYDLYRTMAEKSEADTAKKAFFSISQAEKGHMRTLIRAIPDCPG